MSKLDDILYPITVKSTGTDNGEATYTIVNKDKLKALMLELVEDTEGTYESGNTGKLWVGYDELKKKIEAL